MRLFQKDGMKLKIEILEKLKKFIERKFKSNHNSFLLSFGLIINMFGLSLKIIVKHIKSL